jgi:hypothetical protein
VRHDSVLDTFPSTVLTGASLPFVSIYSQDVEHPPRNAKLRHNADRAVIDGLSNDAVLRFSGLTILQQQSRVGVTLPYHFADQKLPDLLAPRTALHCGGSAS